MKKELDEKYMKWQRATCRHSSLGREVEHGR